MDSILSQVVSILFIAIAINIVLRKINITPIIGYILTGMLAKVAFNINDSESLVGVAEFGIIFLMFMIGLEFSISKLIAMRTEVLGLGGAQIAGSGIIFFLVGLFLFNMRIEPAVAISLTLAFSSTTIVLKILQETGKMGRNHGRISVGILLMQDIAVVPVLILLTLFAQKDVCLTKLLQETITNSLAGVMAIYLFGKYGVNYFLTHVAGARSSELFMTAVLFVVLSAAAIAHFFKVPYSLGAFIAGVIISESAYKHQIEADLIPFRDLLLGLFFISVGLMIDMRIVFQSWLTIILITFGVMIVKTVVVYIAAKSFGYSGRTAIKSALILSQVGELAFVIFAFASELKIIESFTSQVLIASTALSMLVTPFIARYINHISYRFAQHKDNDIALSASGLEHHVVVVGMGYTGRSVVKNLQQMGISYIAVESQRDLVYDGQAKGYNVIFGNATLRSILDILRVDKAAAVIVTIDREKELLSLCDAVKCNYPKVNLVARTRSETEYNLIRAAGVRMLVNESGEIGKRLVDMALACEISKAQFDQDVANYNI